MPGTPLTNIKQIVERSLFHAIREEVVDKEYVPDVLETIDNAITGVDQGLQQFVVLGDITATHFAPRTFEITGDTNNPSNNGVYTISASSFAGGDTTITVVEAIPSATVAGQIELRVYFNDALGIALFKTDLSAIKATKGFAIEIFGVSAPHSKHLKKIPRIVILANRTLPGALGGAPDRFYGNLGDDPFFPNSYVAKILPPQTVDFQYDIHIISNEARQSRVMHELVALALPKRGYINTFLNPTQKIFVRQYSYRDIPNTSKGIDEQVYLYEVKDIFETDDKVVQQDIKPLVEIKIIPHLGDSVPPSQTPTNTQQVDDIIIN